MRRINLITATFVVCVVLGFVLRIFSINWNKYPHMDIYYEVLSARQFPDTYTLSLPFPGTMVAGSQHFPNQQTMADRPPLMIVLESIVSQVLSVTTYQAAQLISLITGLLCSVLLYDIIRYLTRKQIAYLTTAIFSLSFLIIDYSANGSRYMLQNMLILSIIYLVLKKKALWQFAAFSALLFLNNYQMAPLIIALFSFLLFSKVYSFWSLFFGLLLYALMLSPLIIYMYYHFGTFFYETASPYFAIRMGIVDVVDYTWEKPHFVFTQTLPGSEIFALYWKRQALVDMVKNSIYGSKQMFEFLPLYPIMLFLGIKYKDQIFREIRKKKHYLFILIITTVYGLTITIKPLLNFRYFPSLYTLLLINFAYLCKFTSLQKQKALLLSLLVFTGAVSFLVYLRNPFHTYYAGGVVLEDQVRKRTEVDHMYWNERVARAGKYLPGDGVVGTDELRSYHAPNGVLLGTPLGFPEDAQEIIDTYNLKYIWIEKPVTEEYLNDHPDTKLLYSDVDQFIYQL